MLQNHRRKKACSAPVGGCLAMDRKSVHPRAGRRAPPRRQQELKISPNPLFIRPNTDLAGYSRPSFALAQGPTCAGATTAGLDNHVQ